MKRKIINIIFIFCINIPLTFANRNFCMQEVDSSFFYAGQELISLMMSGKYFEARTLYDSIKIEIDKNKDIVLENFYRLQMSKFENKPDSTAFYLNNILTNGYFIKGIPVFELCYELWKVYAEDLQDYENAIEVCNKTKDYLAVNPENLPDSIIQELYNYISDWEYQTRNRAIEPKIQIVRDTTANNYIYFTTDDSINKHIFIDISYNNSNEIKTLFDTGMGVFFLMDKDIAEKIGVRKYHIYTNDTMEMVNKKQVYGYIGILDSVKIANIKLYNVPVSVIDKYTIKMDSIGTIDSTQLKNIENVYKQPLIVIGLQAMNLINNIVINLKDSIISFPMKDIKTNSPANIFVSEKQLLTKISINNLPMKVIVDTGDGEFVLLTSSFQENNKDNLTTDIVETDKPHGTMYLHQVYCYNSYNIIKSPFITFDNIEVFPSINSEVQVMPDSLLNFNNIVDGSIGMEFFKCLGNKISFDFRNMRIDVLE